MPEKAQVRFSFKSRSANEKGYEISFIHEGKANGWTFPKSVLQESANLWNETNVFVDHSFWGRSVRELGGVLSAVQWSDEQDGLTATLTLAGPSAEIIREAGQTMLGDGAKPNLGFSADVMFTADAKGVVEKIVKPVSVDLVINPAFATKFIRQLNSRAREHHATIAHPDARASGKGVTNLMPQPTNPTQPEPTTDANDAVRDLLQATEEINNEIEQSRQVHQQMCDNLLTQSLDVANLPEAAEKDIRNRFEGRTFKAQELKDAIAAMRAILSDAETAIQGPGRVSGMQTGGENFEAAVYDLLGCERPEALQKAKPAPLSGIREMYTLATGDLNFHGGANLYYSSDGTTWNYTTKTGGIYSVEWSEDTAEFVAVGNGVCYTSPDGTTWTSRTIQSNFYVDIAYSFDLGLFAAVANGGQISTSTDGHTWTAQTVPNSNTQYGISWSPYNQLFIAVGSAGTGNRLLFSADGETWTEGTTGTDGSWYRVTWGEAAHNWIIVASTGAVQLTTSLESVAEDHSITRGDVVLLKDGVTLKFMWRDELGTVNTDGSNSSLIHNLGYLETTASPPASYTSNERGHVTVGIHLKYKTGDIFKLAINSSQSSKYIGKVTEVLDPSAKIGWRCEIELIDRFANTNGGALPSTIERISAYTPLVTTNFDNNLDSTVNNLQALADAVDDLDISAEGTQAEIYAASAKSTPANSDLFGLLDSAASYVLKNITWLNIKSALKSYFDSFYATITHTHTDDGWTDITDTWTRTGNYTFTVPGDVTGDYEYQPGTKITCSCGSTKYGVIESAVYSSITTITLVTNDDYMLTAGYSITSPRVSHHADPEGFPEWFNFTPSWSCSGSMTISSVSLVFAQWRIQGKTCHYAGRAEFTLGGSASPQVRASWPVACNLASDGPVVAGYRDSATGALLVGTGAVSVSNSCIIVLKQDISNWSTGRLRRCDFYAVYPWA